MSILKFSSPPLYSHHSVIKPEPTSPPGSASSVPGRACVTERKASITSMTPVTHKNIRKTGAAQPQYSFIKSEPSSQHKTATISREVSSASVSFKAAVTKHIFTKTPVSAQKFRKSIVPVQPQRKVSEESQRRTFVASPMPDFNRAHRLEELRRLNRIVKPPTFPVTPELLKRGRRETPQHVITRKNFISE